MAMVMVAAQVAAVEEEQLLQRPRRSLQTALAQIFRMFLSEAPHKTAPVLAVHETNILKRPRNSSRLMDMSRFFYFQLPL
jgi:hypothetical protein